MTLENTEAAQRIADFIRTGRLLKSDLDRRVKVATKQQSKISDDEQEALELLGITERAVLQNAFDERSKLAEELRQLRNVLNPRSAGPVPPVPTEPVPPVPASQAVIPTLPTDPDPTPLIVKAPNKSGSAKKTYETVYKPWKAKGDHQILCLLGAVIGLFLAYLTYRPFDMWIKATVKIGPNLHQITRKWAFPVNVWFFVAVIYICTVLFSLLYVLYKGTNNKPESGNTAASS